MKIVVSKPLLLFYDISSPIAYSKLSFQQQALRGTEGTLVRIAHGLSSEFDIAIAQHMRKKEENLILDNVHYIDVETAHTLRPDIVILLRDYLGLEIVGQRFPKARHFFWMHNMPPKQLRAQAPILNKYHYEIIAVSHFHRNVLIKKLSGKWYQRVLELKKKTIPVHVLYNPISDDLHPDATVVNPNQLFFMSAPYKGLPETLAMFEKVRQHFPEYKLLIANPSEQAVNANLPKNVEYLGSLSHDTLLHYLRSSFCVFYPQTKRVETFGLVYAEANAAGTPVLAHDFGAAREVLNDNCQLVNGHSIHSVINKITEWRNTRPVLEGKDIFRLHHILKTWLNVLT